MERGDAFFKLLYSSGKAGLCHVEIVGVHGAVGLRVVAVVMCLVDNWRVVEGLPRLVIQGYVWPWGLALFSGLDCGHHDHHLE